MSGECSLLILRGLLREEPFTRFKKRFGYGV
jgi:hypothetical protein